MYVALVTCTLRGCDRPVARFQQRQILNSYFACIDKNATNFRSLADKKKALRESKYVAHPETASSRSGAQMSGTRPR
ncbi:Protein of unknown function [Gryllus bimaculatus]|nr:Protein of unknown function [Gryllus bimaculatus]